MITLKRIFLLLALGACLAAAGCGSDDEGGKPIPAAQAAQLQNQLDIVERRLDNGSEGACKDILDAQDANDDAVTNILNTLPNGVDPDVRDALEESFDNLWNLVESQCNDLKPDEPTQTETTPPETTPTETTPPETETTPPATETTPPATETTPPDGNGNSGGAIPPEGQRQRQRWRSRPWRHRGEAGEAEVSPPTEVAGRYVIERRLGAGGMSTVFMAKDTVLERPVAVKLLAEHLADDEDFVYRFRREALAAAKLQHPNIVQVFDSGQDPASHRHYIVMEYVDGPSAADMLREHKQLGIDETVRLVRDACHGLDYAHRAGVVHRDVKPGNLLFAKEMGTTKLADFGIAKAAEQTRITQVGSVLGTAAYLSPEQARGEEAGPASDIYSLGVCAYQFLTGRLPHEYTLTHRAGAQAAAGSRGPGRRDYRPEVPAELDEAVRLASNATRPPATRTHSRWRRRSRPAPAARPRPRRSGSR